MKKEYIQETILPNGVHVATETFPWLDPDGAVAFGINVGIGSAGNQGVAHAVEHMCLYGASQHHPAGYLQKRLSTLGYSGVNAATGLFGTFYGSHNFSGLVVCKEDLLEAFTLYSNAILYPEFDGKTLESQRGRIIAEYEGNYTHVRTQILKASAERWQTEWLMYPGTGTSKDIKAFDAQNLTSFHGKHYKNANIITIAAAGVIEHQEFVDLVAERFGALTRGSLPYSEIGQYLSIQHNVVDRPVPKEETNRGQTTFLQRFPYQANTYEDYCLARAASIVLNKLLFEKISNEAGLVYDIAADIETLRHPLREHYIRFTAHASEALPIVEKVYEQMQRLINLDNKEEMWGYAEEALVGLRKFSRLREATSSSSVRQLIGDISTFGRTILIQETLGIVEKLTIEQIAHAVKDIFSGPLSVLSFNDEIAREMVPTLDAVNGVRSKYFQGSQKPHPVPS